MRKQINEKAINGLYHSNGTARIIFEELSKMPRQEETELDKIENRITKSGKEVSRKDVVSTFRSLEEYGVGEFIPGRRGHPSRFRWEVDSINIGNLDAPKPAPTTEHREAVIGSTTLISHHYQLRQDLVISIQLPSDITTVEAQRLSQFINSLPFHSA